MGDDVVGILRGLAAPRHPASGNVLIGLIGRGIQASRTPVMHEREAERLGLGCTYVLVDFDRLGLADDRLGEVIAAAAECGFDGLNVTHPFKQAAIGHVDLRAPDGATIEEIAAALQWAHHTIRGALAGALKKKLGLTITSEKIEGRGRVYAIR